MRVYPERLVAELKKQLRPCYLIHGEEQLLRDESAQLIREQAKLQGYMERNLFFVDRNLDWALVDTALDSYSLFAEKKIVDLRFENLPNKEERSRLEAITEHLSEDILLIISMKKLETSQQKTKWFKRIDGFGVNIPCWPIGIDKLPQWLTQRAKRFSLGFTNDALMELASFVEGNLFAAHQELEKMALIHEQGTISVEQLRHYVASSARYNNFILIDAILAGETQRALTILDGLQREGVQIIAIIALLIRELKQLITCAFRLQEGATMVEVLVPPLVWASRKNLYAAMLKRHRLITLQRMLKRCTELDRMSKGSLEGDAWDELITLILMMVGVHQWQTSLTR